MLGRPATAPWLCLAVAAALTSASVAAQTGPDEGGEAAGDETSAPRAAGSPGVQEEGAPHEGPAEPPLPQGGRAPEPPPATDEPRVSLEIGDGLTVESADGAHALSIGLRFQLRPAVTVPDGGDAAFDLNIRRARVNFSGHVFGEENRFRVQLALSPEDLGLEDGVVTQSPVLDYYLELRHLRDLEVVIGQYKRPFARERIISSGSLALVDRSVVDEELELDRDLGFDLRSRDLFGLGWLRYYLGISTGEGRDGGTGDDLGFVYFGRIELLPLGLFDDHTQTDFSRSPRPRLSLGLAYAYLDEAAFTRGLIEGERFADQGTADYHTAAADLLLLVSGVTLEADFIVRHGQRDPGGAVDQEGNPIAVTPPSNGLGWFVQASWLLPGVDLEIGARWGMTVALGPDDETIFRERGELGGGVAYYFAGHDLSLHLDYFHLWSDDFEVGQEQIRMQLELIL